MVRNREMENSLNQAKCNWEAELFNNSKRLVRGLNPKILLSSTCLVPSGIYLTVLINSPAEL